MYKHSNREEREVPRKEARRFFEMDAEAEEKLREQIEGSDGLVRIFVHPEWSTYQWLKDVHSKEIGKEYAPSAINLARAEAAFKKIITSKSPKSPPVIVALGINNIQAFHIRYQDEALNNVYIIPTIRNSPTPLTPKREPSSSPYTLENDLKKTDSESFAQLEEDGWQMFIEQLKVLGVEKVLIGGAELYVFDSDEGVPQHGCVGRTIRRLHEEFDVEVSALAWPDARKDLKKPKEG